MSAPAKAPPWNRLPTDTDKSWEAFQLYRDAGPRRSLTEVARKLTKSVQLVSRWSQHHDWSSRCAEYDRDQDTQWQAQVTAERHLVAKRHATTARAFQDKVIRRLRTIDPNDLAPADLLRWWEVAVRIERDVYGMTDDANAAAALGGVNIIIDSRLITPPTQQVVMVDADPDPHVNGALGPGTGAG